MADSIFQNGAAQMNSADMNSGAVNPAGPAKKKWSYMVYFAADNNLECFCLYDLIMMQQAVLNPGIDIYVLVDRPAEAAQTGDMVTVHGTYKWDYQWTDTRVGKITASPGMTVTVDWTSWEELDTGSPKTLNRFVDWVQQESQADNYGLIMWDHGAENATLCVDETPDPQNKTSLSISDVAETLKGKDNIPLVIFNNCVLGSEITATQLAGSTEVIVCSEPISYAMGTYSYKQFFNTITTDMTPQEMAAVMVQNVQSPANVAAVTMLSAVDVTNSKLGDALEALAGAVADAGNATDKAVLIHAMKKAPQDGCLYDAAAVYQSDLYDMILQAMADDGYKDTSARFQTALAAVKSAIENAVLSFRSVPSGHGYGIAYCNTVSSVVKFITSGLSMREATATIKKHLDSCYGSNPRWGALLYDLGAIYLEQEGAKLILPATFTVTDNSELVKGKVVRVSDLGCFSGQGANFDGITLIGDFFFKVAITGAATSSGSLRVENNSDAEISVSLLSGNGDTVISGTNAVSFANLAPADYFLRLRSDTNCAPQLFFEADWATGVDRFDYAQSGLNVKNADGNGSFEKATPLAEGYFPGLLTSAEDRDFYRIGNVYSEQYKITVQCSTELNVLEYDEKENFVKTAEEDGGVYTLVMGSGHYLLVSGTADLGQEKVDSYSLAISDIVEENIRIENLVGTSNGVAWKTSSASTSAADAAILSECMLGLSTDNFEHLFCSVTIGNSMDFLNLPAGTYPWGMKTESDKQWTVGGPIVSENNPEAPEVFRSTTDGDEDLFWATSNSTWETGYCARHNGSVNGWSGTGETVSIGGKNRIDDFFFGSADPNTLILTDSENGDALFADDIYTALPEKLAENTSRLSGIREILAGGGDDVVDMTSQRFEYAGTTMTLRGGDGNDTIWADKTGSRLFGDDGDDRLVGGDGDDLIVGGIGDDTMHGGGGNDIFAFCEDWGTDTIEQREGGALTLWFASGNAANWNVETLTYTDKENSVTVSGVGAQKITLKFGDDESAQFETLSQLCAFEEISSGNIFDKKDEEKEAGILAGR